MISELIQHKKHTQKIIMILDKLNLSILNLKYTLK